MHITQRRTPSLSNGTHFLSKKKKIISVLTILLLALALIIAIFAANKEPNIPTPDVKGGILPQATAIPNQIVPTPVPLKPGVFIASIDTMKESRDTETRPLTQQQIQQIVELSASVNNNYITVDTNWDYPQYIGEWVNAIRAVGKRVWFRTAPNQWENDNGVSGTMTPTQYENTERAFILNHPDFFRSGDIFDACPEPEQGHYWERTYKTGWTSNAPNAATRDYNSFIRDTTNVATESFKQQGISGVITTIRSINSFFASHPDVLEAQTVALLGHITIDSYPEDTSTDPNASATLRVSEIQDIENLWHVPIIIGEMGYSNNVNVDDATQALVLQAEFKALEPLKYIGGMNYWVGAGSPIDGGYTYLFTQATNGKWVTRPATTDLSSFYKLKISES